MKETFLYHVQKRMMMILKAIEPQAAATKQQSGTWNLIKHCATDLASDHPR